MSDQETTSQSEIAAEPVITAAAPEVSQQTVRTPKAKKPARAVKAVPAPAPAAKPVVKAARKPAAKQPAPVRTVKKPVAAKPGKTLSETFPMTTDFTEAFKTVFADAQGKAKAAYEKGTASFAEAGEFAKGNAEAVVESGKILAEGLQTLTSGFVADSKSVFEGLTAEVKELTAAKSPTDFFKLQGDLMKKYFDSSIAYGSKQSEALMKLTTEAAAPISRRVSLAVEKAKAA